LVVLYFSKSNVQLYNKQRNSEDGKLIENVAIALGHFNWCLHCETREVSRLYISIRMIHLLRRGRKGRAACGKKFKLRSNITNMQVLHTTKAL